MSGEVHGCKTCGGSHFGHNGCPFAEIAEASSKGETSAVTAAEKPQKIIIKFTQGGTTGCTQDAYDRIGKIVTTAGSAETGGEKADDM